MATGGRSSPSGSPQVAPMEPPRSALPVRWSPQGSPWSAADVLDGTVDVADLVTVGLDWESHQWEEAAMAGEAEPDASTRGWVVPPGGHRVDAIFVLSTDNLGIGRHDTVHPTLWLKLAHLRTLDAIGDPVDGQIEVEIVMDDGQVIGAGWDEAFCDAVVATLRDTLDRSAGRGRAGSDTSARRAPAPAAPSAPAAPPAVTDRNRSRPSPELPDAAGPGARGPARADIRASAAELALLTRPRSIPRAARFPQPPTLPHLVPRRPHPVRHPASPWRPAPRSGCVTRGRSSSRTSSTSAASPVRPVAASGAR